MPKNLNILTLKDIAYKLYGNTFVINNKVYYCEPGHPGFALFSAPDGVSYRLPEIPLSSETILDSEDSINVKTGSKTFTVLYPIRYLRVPDLCNSMSKKPGSMLIVIDPQNRFLVGHRVNRVNGKIAKVVNGIPKINSKYIQMSYTASKEGISYRVRIAESPGGYKLPLKAMRNNIEPNDIKVDSAVAKWVTDTIEEKSIGPEGDYRVSKDDVIMTISVYKKIPEISPRDQESSPVSNS